MKRTKLKMLRVERGWNQTEVANRIGMSITAYCFLETGRSDTSKETWDKIQELYNLKDEEMWAIRYPREEKVI